MKGGDVDKDPDILGSQFFLARKGAGRKTVCSATLNCRQFSPPLSSLHPNMIHKSLFLMCANCLVQY